MPHAPGTPCWVDLSTTHPEAARAFFAAVLGWTYDEQGEAYGHYAMCHAGDEVAAGMGPIPEGAEFPPSWTVYLAVEDVQATVARAQELGGQVVTPPFEVPSQGHMAVVADPGGAVVGLWQPLEHAGFTTMGAPGTPCWFEVNTRAGEATRDFYTALFGLTHESMPMGATAYWTVHQGGRPRYGVLQMTDEWEGIPPHWMAYFTVPDTDAAVAAVKVAGGRLHVGPRDTAFGRFAVCGDPQGATFTLLQLPDHG